MQYATVRPPVSLAGETTEDGDDASASKEVEASLRALFEIGADENCVQCIGKGEIECPLCMGKGFTSMRMMDVVSSSTCRLCHGRCIAPCPTCREEVYRSVLWWDRIPTDDVEERWREGPDGPRIEWGGNPTEGG